MRKIARFEKVSYEQFEQDMKKCNFVSEDIKQVYDQLELPKRATMGSAGYDFFAPITFTIKPHEQILVPTGIRAYMEQDYVLMLFPRSSLGFKYRVQMNNTVGIIDSDYYGASNQGHIFVKLYNDSAEEQEVTIQQGQGMLQGIFVPFGVTVDDEVDTVRVGGIGSTNKKG